MKLSVALNIATNEIREVLISSGLIDGTALTVEQIQKEKSVVFWEEQIRESLAAKKEAYVVYDIISLNPIKRADDKVKSRDAFVGIDLYSRQDFNSNKVKRLIQQLEDNFIARGWIFDFNERRFEYDTQFYHVSFYASKEIR